MGTTNSIDSTLAEVWQLYKREGKFPKDVELFYENLFENVSHWTSVWDLDNFNIFRKMEDELELYVITPQDIVEGVLVCFKCKCKKIFSFSKQTKSGDESTSVFAKCSNCQHQWIQ